MFERVKMTTGKQQIVGHYEADLKGVIMKKIDKKKRKYLLLQVLLVPQALFVKHLKVVLLLMKDIQQALHIQNVSLYCKKK